MADNHDYIALDWVRGEIEQTLTQAQNALEAFVEEQSDTTQLTFCLNYIHQVHGTLQMVEFYGASLLAEEMEGLCQSLIDQKLTNVEEALEVLMGALLQLQNYLEHIKVGQKDLPIVLMPTLNDLRAAQGRPLLSDTSLFTPDLSAAHVEANPEHNKRMQDAQVLANLRKLRQMFQVSLVGVIRNQDVAANFSYLYKVLARLEKFCQGTPIGKIWWISVGFLDALQDELEGLGTASKSLLRELDNQIKEMIEHPEDILQRPVPQDLLKNLLYYIAKTKTESKRIGMLKEAFGLEQALPDIESLEAERQRLTGPSQDTMDSVVAALAEELNQVKDQLDLYVRDTTRDKSNLESQLPILNQVANTLSVLGQGAARTLLLRQISRIESLLQDSSSDDDQILLQIASDLLQVESNLSSGGDATGEDGTEPEEFAVPAQQFESAHNAVIFESKNGLEQAKNSIVGFIASKWDHAEIEDVPDLLDSIRGGLQIIPLTKAAELLGACSQYIRDEILASQSVPEWEQLDRLADAITSIEYYMDRLSAGASENEKILDVAEASLADLATQKGSSVEEISSSHHKSEVAAESPDAIVKESDEALIDEEILEIFVEEVEEVSVNIREALGKLQNNPEDSDSLKELRRAFHTLKGSGRLVGAATIGEIGWSVENLLNKYIEQGVEPGFEDFDLVELTLQKLPALVAHFSGKGEAVEFEDIIGAAERRMSALFGEQEKAATEQSSQDTAPEAEAEAEAEVEAEVEVEVEVEAVTEKPDQPVETEDEDDLIDDEILEIFIEEAEEVSETIDEFLPAFLQEFDNKEALSELRRAYHTLKGSGRMVGASDIGETAWAVENMLNRVIDGSILVNQDIADLVKYVSGIIPELVENFKHRTEPEYLLESLQQYADSLAKGELVPALGTMNFKQGAQEPGAAIENATGIADATIGVDETLLEIFESEVSGHIKTIENFIAQARQKDEPQAIDDALSRALHTLKGSANTANIACIAEVAVPTEKLIKEMRARQLKVSPDVVELLDQAIELTKEGLGHVSGDASVSLSGTEVFLQRLTELQTELLADVSDSADLEDFGGQDPQLVSIFLTEGLDILLDAEKILDDWQQNPVSSDSLDQLFGEVKTLHRGAQVAGLSSIAELCSAIESCYSTIDLESASVAPEMLADIKEAHEVLIDMMDQVAAGLSAEPNQELIQRLHAYSLSEPAEEREPQSEEIDLTEKLDELDQEITEVIPDYQVQDSESPVPEDSQAMPSELDQELIEIFLDEAKDILSGLPALISQIQLPDPSEQAIQQIERDFHTLKGGARMAHIQPVGDLANSLETLFNKLVIKQAHVAPNLFELLGTAQETFARHLEQMSNGEALRSVDDLVSVLDAYNGETEAISEDPDHSEHKETESGAIQATAPDDESVDEHIELDLDPELIEIFLDEAQDIIDSSAELLHQWENDTSNLDLVGELQRELHTLKGGARMSELPMIGDMAHELETLFERIVESRYGVQPAMIALCLSCHDALASMVDAVRDGQAIPSAKALLGRIKEVAATGNAEASVSPEPSAPEPLQPEEESAASEQSSLEVAQGHEDTASEAEAEAESHVSQTLADLDPELVEIFLEEAGDIIDNTGSLLHQWETDVNNLDLVAELQRELHTLKGGARMAELSMIGDMAHELETLFERIVESRYGVQSGMIALCLSCHDALASMVDAVRDNQPLPSANDLLDQIKQLAATGQTDQVSSTEAVEDRATENVSEFTEDEELSASNTVDIELESDLLPMFLDESKDILTSFSEFLEQWRDDLDSKHPAVELQREMHTLKGGARLADIDAIADIADAIETRLHEVADGKIEDKAALLKTLTLCHQELSGMVALLADGESVLPQADLIEQIKLAGVNKAEESQAQPIDALEALNEIDPEVLEIFIEEAKELSEALEEQMSQWADAPVDEAINREIQRVLHTLKGGARLSNLKALADESHDLETLLVKALGAGQAFEGDFKQEVLGRQDKILKQVDLIESRLKGEVPSEESVETPVAEKMPKTEAETPKASDTPPAEVEPEKLAAQTQKDKKAKKAPKKAVEAKKAVETTKAPAQETIRVSSTLMEGLVNLAGETSISRGRLETQISDFGFTLEEMSATIERLREQLRRMEMETEAQVLFRAEKEGFAGSEYDDFDPLEMDRYSSIQQLSRSLTESTTDLMELREALADRARGAETLLLQQSRINSELQEGLMKTRMIPFSSMVPRLRRIVRQISGELNKQVEFNVANAEGEMDRSILERMVAPLEHMLRNALDHGIESADARIAAGKPEVGTIRLSLSREGGDVVLRMSDDGGGINDQRIFEKAVSQGLVSADAKVGRHDILQFIMLPGFSTAEQVTQISGRGVGMDVVASEIKQMGGSIEIDSNLGKGTEFTVRLPFTVSVNRALMVSTGDDFYAIPLNTIEGIVRVSPFELEEYYKPDAPLYEYAGRKYQLQYLGKLIHSSHQPKLQGQPLPLPVILVRGAERPMALQVDSLMGSREIVVKSLGPQFGGVHAVSGATILGDGSVVIILDLPALIRDESAGLLDKAEETIITEDVESETPMVMVVDDSVTVRKVTTRLLERNGMEVVTAKDGVDAIAQLQDCKPDVMLLDIEMPRMDGFEVATLVRHDERLKDVPIIMITSRTGQKHRERALSIGVNEYLGKPFQEQELLETIEKLVAVART